MLLRSGALVDLYDVVRRALLIGEPRYSIKNVEKLYRPSLTRQTDVGKGDQSVAVYAAWLDEPDGLDDSSSPTLASLAEYNRDDCESTRQLYDWLWALRSERCSRAHSALAAAEAPAGSDAEDAEGASEARDEPVASLAEEEEAEVARLRARLLVDDGWPVDGALSEPVVRETLAGMLAYHRREAKPGWWRRYDWLASTPAELESDPRTLGGLERTGREPFKSAPRKRRLAYECHFDASQECRMAEGQTIVVRDDAMVPDGTTAPSGGEEQGGEWDESSSSSSSTTAAAAAAAATTTASLSGSILSLDRASGVAVVECGQPLPSRLSLLPNEWVPAPSDLHGTGIAEWLEVVLRAGGRADGLCWQAALRACVLTGCAESESLCWGAVLRW